MRLTCPECAAEYDVPDAALAPGRRLRCSACKTTWTWNPPEPPTPEAPPPEPPAPSLKEPRLKEPAQVEPPRAAAAEAPARAAPQAGAHPERDIATLFPPEMPRIDVVRQQRIVPPAPPPRRRGRFVTLAWIVSIAIVVAGLVAVYVLRDQIMQAWPPAIRFYTALGLV